MSTTLGLELASLLARVEEATGPDREIDTDICVALRQYSEEGYARFGRHHPVGYYLAHQGIAPNYTASLDAALGLCERVLPGWMRFVGDLDPSDMRACATITHERPPTPAFRGFAPQGQYALALVAALLRALIAQGVA